MVGVSACVVYAAADGLKKERGQTTATKTCKLPSLFYVMQHLLGSAGLLSLRVHMGCDINHIHFSAAASKHFARLKKAKIKQAKEKQRINTAPFLMSAGKLTIKVKHVKSDIEDGPGLIVFVFPIS